MEQLKSTCFGLLENLCHSKLGPRGSCPHFEVDESTLHEKSKHFVLPFGQTGNESLSIATNDKSVFLSA